MTKTHFSKQRSTQLRSDILNPSTRQSAIETLLNELRSNEFTEQPVDLVTLIERVLLETFRSTYISTRTDVHFSGSPVFVPVKATHGAAGYDICTTSPTTVLKAGERKTFNTGLVLDYLNPRLAMFLYSRSSMSRKGIMLGNNVGIIDSDFRGEIKVDLLNLGDQDVEIKYGDRIAQLVFHEIPQSVSFTSDYRPYQSPVTDKTRSLEGWGGSGSGTDFLQLPEYAELVQHLAKLTSLKD